MAIPARIHLVTLGVSDLARSTAFYEALGWRRSPASAEGVSFFLTGGAILSLFGFRDLADDAHLPASDRPATGGVALAINVRSEAEVDAALADAERAGATILKPAQRVFWGGYSGYFADPDGHAWEVAYNPFFPFAADGSLDLPE